MEEKRLSSHPLIVPFIIGAGLFLHSNLLQANTIQGKDIFLAKPIGLLAVNTFIYNPKTLRWKAVKNGRVIRTGRGSGGRSYCPDVKRSCRTPTGTYRIISKRGPSCRSSRYPVGRGGAPMPYCMFFSKYYAIHGSPDVPNYNASHGCIRVKPHDARWLHQNFLHIGSKVVVQPY
ncbi:L,D-transpeptidase [Legionella londiniensis]|uniref:Enhanced entry protein EnhA n=1 Tax=Legionella londiniensis TaxID=45068 RepID=A0A0W0VKK6_9GAMM|nr:L,D-transpeptidase [Legionella londiniensis]KTD20642.1 enhanced entry protein EnhA [Legionella londiniensis]STX92887.1 enhanced entry protein EnhA [Legionella londiniensis]